MFIAREITTRRYSLPDSRLSQCYSLRNDNYALSGAECEQQNVISLDPKHRAVELRSRRDLAGKTPRSVFELGEETEKRNVMHVQLRTRVHFEC